MCSRLIAQLAVALAAVALTGCGPDSRDGPAGDLTVGLAGQGGAGQSATAALVAQGDQTLVVIEVDGNRVTEVQEAHIHEGTCDELRAEQAVALQSTSSARSATTVDVPLDALTSGTYATVVHDVGDGAATQTSCGRVTA